MKISQRLFRTLHVICTFIKSNDRNSDIMNMLFEWLGGEVSLDALTGACDRVLVDWLPEYVDDETKFNMVRMMIKTLSWIREEEIDNGSTH